jgi:hypothetical protein
MFLSLFTLSVGWELHSPRRPDQGQAVRNETRGHWRPCTIKPQNVTSTDARGDGETLVAGPPIEGSRGSPQI